VAISGETGQGLDLLREHLKGCIGFRTAGEGTFTARRRHLDVLERAGAALRRAVEQLETTRVPELLAEELRQAQVALGEITGEFTPNDLLDRIFASFCIGK
jgi:tRNA modification GTPase